MTKMSINKINRQNNRIFSRYAFEFILKSYETFVACINRDTGVGYDLLRYVYCYTVTSAQHISKFFNDYNAVIIIRYCPN